MTPFSGLHRLALAAGLILAAGTGLAGEADVLSVKAVPEGGGLWRFHATVRHADEGWNHYADNWQVLTLDGRVLGTRVLLHPHEHEQPFTRSLGGVAVPDGIDRVIVRAHDSQHGTGGAEATVELPR